MSKSALIAVGGNALIRAGERGTISEQIKNARCVSEAIATLVSEGIRIVITHGNGPQVGATLLRSERAAGQVYELGLDVCVAATQGEIGYLLQQSLDEAFSRAGISRSVTTVLTQVVVAPDDQAFLVPSKPIGPFYSRAAAEEKMKVNKWQMKEDAYRGYRRVVPSPEPLEIVEREVIRRMLDDDIMVIALGGGGIPVVREKGALRGVEAVIDKDRASALLAISLPVDTMVFLTDADYVYLNFNKSDQCALEKVFLNEMKSYYDAGHFPPGSMGPKIEAAMRFLGAGGKEVIVTSHDHLEQAFKRNGGTHIVAAGPAGVTV